MAAFEAEFADYVGAAHAKAVSNATSALHMALLAVGVGPGDEVLAVSHSFIATANSVRYCGAMPVFVDVDLHTFNMDPALLETAWTPRIKAVLCVHQLAPVSADDRGGSGPCRLGLAPRVRRLEQAACARGSCLLPPTPGLG